MELSAELVGRIEEAVLEEFSNNDFHRATTREIAAKAKTSLSKLYALGATKDEVFFHFVSMWMTKLTSLMELEMAKETTAKGRLGAALEVEFAFYDRDPRIARALFLTLPRGIWTRDPSFRNPAFRQLLRTIEIGRAEGTVVESLDKINLADAVVGIIDRAVVSWLFRGSPNKIADKTPDILRLIWRVICVDCK